MLQGIVLTVLVLGILAVGISRRSEEWSATEWRAFAGRLGLAFAALFAAYAMVRARETLAMRDAAYGARLALVGAILLAGLYGTRKAVDTLFWLTFDEDEETRQFSRSSSLTLAIVAVIAVGAVWLADHHIVRMGRSLTAIVGGFGLWLALTPPRWAREDLDTNWLGDDDAHPITARTVCGVLGACCLAVATLWEHLPFGL